MANMEVYGGGSHGGHGLMWNFTHKKVIESLYEVPGRPIDVCWSMMYCSNSGAILSRLSTCDHPPLSSCVKHKTSPSSHHFFIMARPFSSPNPGVQQEIFAGTTQLSTVVNHKIYRFAAVREALLDTPSPVIAVVNYLVPASCYPCVRASIL